MSNKNAVNLIEKRILSSREKRPMQEIWSVRVECVCGVLFTRRIHV